MTPIQSLIDQLQAAEHGTPELSEKMTDLLGWRWSFAFNVWQVDGVTFGKVAPQFTTDLNAILAEIERVFPDAYKDIGRVGVTLPWSAQIGIAEVLPFIEATHKSAPLAACIALLRAIEARDMGVER